MSKLLTLAEAAEKMRQPEATLRFWRHQGATGPRSAKLGRRIFYREEDVQAWIDQQFADDNTKAAG